MRPAWVLFALSASFLLFAQQKEKERKLTDDEKIELIRGLSAEYGTVKVFLPRSRKPLRFESNGRWEKQEWLDAGREYGAVAKVGELVQITGVDINSDDDLARRYLFEIPVIEVDGDVVTRAPIDLRAVTTALDARSRIEGRP